MPSPKALQLMLPAIEKMAASPKAEQGIEKIMQMSRMVEPQAAGPNPWQRFIETIQKSQMPEHFKTQPRFPQGLAFEMRKPGTASWSGSVTPTRGNPFELYVNSLQGGGTRRTGIGDLEAGLATYGMDITSPAQRELPLRGMKLGKTEKAQRAPRSYEERYPPPEFMEGKETLPTAKLADKQQAIDTLLRMARGAGFKKLAFSAEPGERPRLYEKLVGYKAKMEGEEDIHSLLGRMPGRGPSAPVGTAAPMNPRQQLAQPGATLSPQTIEQMLGLSVDEAVEFGMARRIGQSNLYQLTDEGRRGAIDWFGEGAGR